LSKEAKQAMKELAKQQKRLEKIINFKNDEF